MAGEIRLRTEYGIPLDRSTHKLLSHSVFHDELGDVAEYGMQFRWFDGVPYLTYSIDWLDDNEYRHKAVRRWLRGAIKEAKSKSVSA